MMSTKEIETTYDITRQTLNNWIQRKIISKPTKKGNKNIWSRTNIIEIERAVSQKNGKTPFFEFDHEKLKINNRRYLGSKQRMLNFIDDVVKENTTDIKSVADIFGGTGVVADLFYSRGNS